MLWLDIISYITNYILLGTWGLLLFYYVVSHVIWAVYFRYQGSCNWYLALLPFYLQYMKLSLCYEGYLLPILYTVTCVLFCGFLPFWLVPIIISSLINRKFYTTVSGYGYPTLFGFVPVVGKVFMVMEVVSNARNATE